MTKELRQWAICGIFMFGLTDVVLVLLIKVKPSNQPSEPYHKIFRDIARSWLWLFTGRTGSSLDPAPPDRLS